MDTPELFESCQGKLSLHTTKTRDTHCHLTGPALLRINLNRACAVECTTATAVYHLLHVLHLVSLFSPITRLNCNVVFFKSSSAAQTSRTENGAMSARVTFMEESVTSLHKELVRRCLSNEVGKPTRQQKKQPTK